MYRKLENKIFELRINKKDLAKRLGIGYNTLCLKLKGTNKFTLDEALIIAKIIDELARDGLEKKLTVEELFEVTQQAG